MLTTSDGGCLYCTCERVHSSPQSSARRKGYPPIKFRLSALARNRLQIFQTPNNVLPSAILNFPSTKNTWNATGPPKINDQATSSGLGIFNLEKVEMVAILNDEHT